MNLYIQIDENGKAVNHPIMEDNLRQAYPGINTNNLPSNFARFQRMSRPARTAYEKEPRVTYELRGDVYTDVYHSEYMTREEAIELQNQVKAAWAANPGPQSWIFNDFTCRYEPPVSYPADGKHYRWDEPTNNWVEVT